MSTLSTTTLAAHFPAVAPEIFRALENEKPFTAGTVKGRDEGNPSKQMDKHYNREFYTMQDEEMKDTVSLWDQTLEDWQTIAQTEGAHALCRRLMLDPRFRPDMPGTLGKFIGETEGCLIPDLLAVLTRHLEKSESFSERCKG